MKNKTEDFEMKQYLTIKTKNFGLHAMSALHLCKKNTKARKISEMIFKD